MLRTLVVVSLLALFCPALSNRDGREDQPICYGAAEAVDFFSGTLQNCSTNSSQPICAQLSQNTFWVPPRSNMLYLLEPYLEKRGLNWLMESLSDTDLMLTAQINGGGSAASRASNPGEIAYVLDKVTSGWAKLLPNASSTVSISVFWSVWTNEWVKAAMRVDLKGAWSYLRAANYFFIAAQPYPITASALKAFSLSYDYLFRHLAISADQGLLTYENISVPYATDGGDEVTLPGITVSPVASSNSAGPQLVVATSGGLDWPLPGEVVRSLYMYLDAGYAVMYYEGPGQGRTLVDPINPLRFTPNWDRVLTAAALYARTNLSLAWDSCTFSGSMLISSSQSKGITAASESLGGYLLTQACSLVDESLVQGCITDPASPNMAYAVGYTVFGRIVSPFALVDPTLLSTACPTCAQFGANYWGVNATYAPPQAVFNPDPLTTALLAANCTFGQTIVNRFMYYGIVGAPAKLAPTSFAWLALTMVEPGPNTYSNLSELATIFDTNPNAVANIIVQAFVALQGFVVSQAQVAATRVLIAAFGGSEDFTTQSSQHGAYTAALPKSKVALTSFFDAHTGAASHCEVGAWSVISEQYYSFLEIVASATQAKLRGQ